MLFHECTECNFIVIFALDFCYALHELGHNHTSQNQRIDRDAPANLNASKGSSVTGTGLSKVGNQDARKKHKYLNYCVNNTVWYWLVKKIVQNGLSRVMWVSNDGRKREKPRIASALGEKEEI